MAVPWPRTALCWSCAGLAVTHERGLRVTDKQALMTANEERAR
jgi:hypothetical protein